MRRPVILAVIALFGMSVACAAHRPVVFHLPPLLAHCTVVQQRGRSVFLACPAQTSYAAGPLEGTRLVELDAITKQVIRVTP